MNRAQRRDLERRIRKAKRLAHPVPGSVTLRGGPMDGWIVKPDAPALDPDWRARWLEEEARKAYERTRLEFAAAHGVPVDDPSVPPPWEALGYREHDHYRAIVRAAHGDGRYVLAEGTRLPEARWEAA